MTFPAPDIARRSRNLAFFVTALFELEAARPFFARYRTWIYQSAILSTLPPHANQAAEKSGDGLVELRELTKHTCRIPRCHASWRDVVGDDAACTNYGAAADADAGKDDRL